MNNPENKQPTGAEQKVNEYVERISTGESKERIFEGLSPLFKTSIEEKLKARETARIADERQIDLIKSELGISVDSQIGNQVGSEKIFSEIESVEISQINENNGIERRKVDSKNVSFKQVGDQVKIFYLDQEWYSKPGQIIEQTVGGRPIRVIVSRDASASHASFEPLTNIYSIGAGAMEEFKKDPEVFLSSIDHEISHEEYFTLDTKQQTEVNDLFLNNQDLRIVLGKFAKAIYSDSVIVGGGTAGDSYLKAHGLASPTTQSLLTFDGQKGLKDSRSMTFELDGKKKEVMVGMLITELISYMSALSIGEVVFEKVAETGRSRRGGKDPRYDVARICFEYIQKNPSVGEALKKLKLIGRNKEMEEFFVGLVQKKLI